jgi:hypothetical protein
LKQPHSRSRRPLGQPTRGKTAHNRLRRVDTFVLLYDPGLITRSDGEFADARFVDVGYGAEPWTTLESAARLRSLNPALRVLGVEIDRERVAAASTYVDELTDFRLGGFDLPLLTDPDGRPERVRLIRAFNVLRQYDESAVAEVHNVLGRHLLPGGLLIEGTSDPVGRHWVANLLRKPAGSPETPLRDEGLLFSTNFRGGFEPRMFQPVLPKNYIHRVLTGEPIHRFFADWTRTYQLSLPLRSVGVRQLFVASARGLADLGYHIDIRRRLLSRGYMRWISAAVPPSQVRAS